MSEYQYHEWQTIDRLLTSAEQQAVGELSSHIKVSSSRAVVTYNWGSFKHKPKKVLLQYFDAYFYMANWGSLYLFFRFPKGLLDESVIDLYCVEEMINFETQGDYQVLALTFNPEDYRDGWIDDNGYLSQFIDLRSDLLEGDLRLLYLAWLKAATEGGICAEDYDDEDRDFEDEDFEDEEIPGLEPPVPPGLKHLTPALQNFIRVFEIDPMLVRAAAETSPDLRPSPAINYPELIARLPRPECDALLARLAQGDPRVGLDLRKRLGLMLPQEHRAAAPRRSFQELFRLAGQYSQAEQNRRAEEERVKHIAEMSALAVREARTWQQVEDLLDNGRKIASVYTEATDLLIKLQQLSEFQQTQNTFRTRLRRLGDKYSHRPSLIERWSKQGWI